MGRERNRPARGSDVDLGRVKRSIGKVLRRARTVKGWTQEDVADYIGVSSEFYARVERGHAWASIGTLRKLAALFRVSADAFLGFKPLGPINVVPDPEPQRMRKLARRLRRVAKKDIRLLHRVVTQVEDAQAERALHASAPARPGTSHRSRKQPEL